MYSFQQLPKNNGKYQVLKQKGIEAIDTLAEFTDKCEEIELINNDHTNVSFKLFDLVFKIRIEFDPKWIEEIRLDGKLRTYRVEENAGETKEVAIPKVEFSYDKHGNIGQRLTCDDFSQVLFDLLIPIILNEMEIKL